MTDAVPHAVGLSVKPEIMAFFDQETNTVSYLVKDPASQACAVIDSVLDFDYASGCISHKSADAIIGVIRERRLTLEWLIETHVHTDHLSAAPYIQTKLGGKLGIGDQIAVPQDTFGKVFNEGVQFRRDGSQFDRLFGDGDRYAIGGMIAFAMYTPGHTPACMTHVIGDAAFIGDTLFMPDGGTARADFPGGGAGMLFRSVPASFRCPGRPACSCVTTTGRTAAKSAGRRRSPRNMPTTSTCMTAFPRTPSSPCARPVMRRWRCRALSFPRSR